MKQLGVVVKVEQIHGDGVTLSAWIVDRQQRRLADVEQPHKLGIGETLTVIIPEVFFNEGKP